MTSEFYISYDGIRLHAKLDKPETSGKYPLMILVHGFTGHMEEPHLLAVTKTATDIGFAVLRVDMYGHGQSDGQFKDHTLFKWIDGILAVIDYAKKLDFVTDLYLCGHSQGGLLTMLAAGMKPDDLKAIIPLAPAAMIPDGARQGQLAGSEYDPDHIPEEIAVWGGYLTLDGNYARVAQFIHVEDAIERYPGPVLMVVGDQDFPALIDWAKKAEQMYNNAKLVLIPGDDHGYSHHMEMMTKAVEDFLKEMNAE